MCCPEMIGYATERFNSSTRVEHTVKRHSEVEKRRAEGKNEGETLLMRKDII